MAQNVSEAKEMVSFKELKGLVKTWLAARETEMAPMTTKNKGKKRKQSNDEPTEKPKHKKKKLELCAEAKARRKAQADRRALKQTEQPDVSLPSRPSQDRVISFRLYLGDRTIRERLVKWMKLAREMRAHANEVLQAALGKGETHILETLFDRVALSSKAYMKMDEARRHSLPEHDRRLPYMDLPVDVQREIVKESLSAAKSAQTNLRSGNNHGYALDTGVKENRYLWIKFTNRMASVDKRNGEVGLMKRYFKDCDCGLYIKDRLVAFVEGRKATKKWGQTMLFGKEGGKSFSIRYDSTRRRWYLILT
jgi:hypothetical protein